MSDFEKGAEAMRASAAREAMNSADIHLSGNENALCIEIADAIRALPLPAPAQQSESREASAMDELNGLWSAIDNLMRGPGLTHPIACQPDRPGRGDGCVYGCPVRDILRWRDVREDRRALAAKGGG